MRQFLRESIRREVPDHLGLAYDAWAPTEASDGKVSDDNRRPWLEMLANTAVSADYARSFERWRQSFSSDADRLAELTLTSRLLVGHGNSSAAEIGLTLHHTWGVPVIPGSALKGLLAHYVDATYGPTDPDKAPWEQEGDERARADYQGVTWNGRRIERGPGEFYRALFGAPDASQDQTMRAHGWDAGASSGLVRFHDALYVPGSVVDDKPFAADVLTVHQKSYYNSAGKSWPNDYDSPNPVAFLTVRPGARLLFALSGPEDWTQLAVQLLHDALGGWGVGGKTSAGYGRLGTPASEAPPSKREATRQRTKPAAPAPTSLKVGDRVTVVLLEVRTKRGGWKARHEGAGLEGPIQNSGHVPSDRQPGDAVVVEVKVSTGKEGAFSYVSGVDARTTTEKK